MVTKHLERRNTLAKEQPAQRMRKGSQSSKMALEFPLGVLDLLLLDRAVACDRRKPDENEFRLGLGKRGGKEKRKKGKEERGEKRKREKGRKGKGGKARVLVIF